MIDPARKSVYTCRILDGGETPMVSFNHVTIDNRRILLSAILYTNSLTVYYLEIGTFAQCINCLYYSLKWLLMMTLTIQFVLPHPLPVKLLC